MFKRSFPFGLFCPMQNSKLSVRWWIKGAKRSPWRNPRFSETKSLKKMNPPNGGAYFKLTMRRHCRGGDEKIDVKVQFTAVADGSVSLPRIAQYGVSAYIPKVALWFWGSPGVMSIV